MNLVVPEVGVRGLVARPSALSSEEYAFSSARASARHLRAVVDFVAAEDLVGAEGALLDFEAILAELGDATG